MENGYFGNGKYIVNDKEWLSRVCYNGSTLLSV